MTVGQLVAVSVVVAFGGGLGATYLTTDGRVQATQSLAVTAKAQPVSFRPYTICSGSKRAHCVVDGDTLWHEGTKIRVADIDAPEVGEPKCSSEAALGAKATRRMLQLVNAGPFEFQAWLGRDEDKYGRKLRVLVRDGRSLGDVLVSEGLARTWSGRREPWC
ncbi:endonuclease YncB(thermonuclease family) [Shinella sp. BE166]|uniref:thermonuclease family protein n=1 Tax=Shinella sp. BE166 TaxID=3373918 RepID=UPI003EBF0FC4